MSCTRDDFSAKIEKITLLSKDPVSIYKQFARIVEPVSTLIILYFDWLQASAVSTFLLRPHKFADIILK